MALALCPSGQLCNVPTCHTELICSASPSYHCGTTGRGGGEWVHQPLPVATLAHTLARAHARTHPDTLLFTTSQQTQSISLGAGLVLRLQRYPRKGRISQSTAMYTSNFSKTTPQQPMLSCRHLTLHQYMGLPGTLTLAPCEGRKTWRLKGAQVCPLVLSILG